MIYLNCNKLPSSGHLASMVNSVSFGNVKKEYRADENISLEYTLDTETQASSRNWIGLFPKGASTLQQYVTFEWTISRPRKESPKKHSITFYYKYHIKNIEPDKEYFFVFVDKQMKVLGSSSYFRFNFISPLEMVESKMYEKLGTCISSTPESFTSLSEGLKTSLHSNEREFQSMNKEHMHYLHFKNSKCMSKHQIPMSSTQIHETSGTNTSGFKTEITLTSPDFPLSGNLSGPRNSENCALCKQPSNFIQREQKLQAKIKVHAEYAHTLEKRIEELEKCLEMSQVAQKQLKLAAHHAKREKLSYQKFVNELMTVLATKGAVRILDGQGTELLLKRIVPENEDNTLLFKTSQRERILKSVISSQERTIRDLMGKVSSNSPVKTDHVSSAPCNLLDEMNNESELHPEKSEDIKSKSFNGNVQAVITVFPQQLSCSEKSVEDEKPEISPLKHQKSVDEFLEEDLLENVLNETYSIETNIGETVSVILPSEIPPYSKVGEEEYKVNISDMVSEKGRGDFHNSSVPVKTNLLDVRQSMMKELTNVIRKRKEDKDQVIDNNPSKTISGNSLNFPIHEIVECKSVEDQNALIIKGDHLQYAIIR